MNIFGYELTFRKSLEPAPSSGGWFPLVRESSAGAWQRGETIEVDTALSHSAVYACVDLISADLAKLPISIANYQSGYWAYTQESSRYPSDTLARIVGCPEEMLTAWRLKGDFKECVTIAGKLALILLGSMRNDALAYCFEDDTEEDPLEALTALAEILGNVDGKTLNDIQNNTMNLGLITEVTDRFEQRAAA